MSDQQNSEFTTRYFENANLHFARYQEAWVEIGKIKSSVVQFDLYTDEDEDNAHPETANKTPWYVIINPQGAKAIPGTHPLPRVTWRSSTQSFAQALSGKSSPDITIKGEGAALYELLTLLSR